MRFLVFSDIHLNLWNLGNPIDRLENQINAIRDVGQHAIENDIKKILFCGDMFHTHGTVNTHVLSKTWNCFSDLKTIGLEFLFIVGNHDQADRSGYVHALGFLEQFGKVIGGEEDDHDFLDVPIRAISYTEDADYLKLSLDDVPKNSIVLMHQGISGVEVNSKGFTLNEILSPDMIPDNILHAFSGHYHTHKRVNDKLTIPGALMQHNFSDAGDRRGFLEVDVSSSGVSINQVESNCFTFENIEYSEDIESKVESCSADFVRIVGAPKDKAKDVSQVLNEKFDKNFKMTYESGPSRVVQNIQGINQLFDEFTKQEKINGDLLETGKKLLERNYETT